MNRKYLWLCAVGMVCVVLIMAVYGSGTFGNPFGSGIFSGEPNASPTPTPSGYDDGGGFTIVTPTPSPSYSPSPTPTPQRYTIHLYVWDAGKSNEHYASIMVVGNAGDLVTVYAELDTVIDVLFTAPLDDEGVYTAFGPLEGAGLWSFWAESATGVSEVVECEIT